MNASGEAFLVLGTTWGSYKCFNLVLPVPKSVLEFIGTIQRKQKKGDGGQPLTQAGAFLLRKSFSLPVALPYSCFVAHYKAGDLVCFLTNKKLPFYCGRGFHFSPVQHSKSGPCLPHFFLCSRWIRDAGIWIHHQLSVAICPSSLPALSSHSLFCVSHSQSIQAL